MLVEKVGPMFASARWRKRGQQLRAFSKWTWHVDEVFVKFNGERHYLWQAVDHEGEVLESVDTTRRNKCTALKMLEKLTMGYGRFEVAEKCGSRRMSASRQGGRLLQSTHVTSL